MADGKWNMSEEEMEGEHISSRVLGRWMREGRIGVTF